MIMSRKRFDHPLVLLLFVLLFLGATESIVAQGCTGVAAELKDAFKAASQTADVLSQGPGGYGRASAKLGKPLEAIRLAAIASEKMCGCSGASDVAGCLQASIDKKFVCDLYELSGAPDFTNPFSVMAIFFPPVGVPLAIGYEWRYGDAANPFCDSGVGESNLVCCKLYPSDRFCQTGFEGEDAVNCLGAPPPYQPVQLGPVEMTPNGPWCNHIPECLPSGQASQTENSKTERQTRWMMNLTDAYANAVYGNGSSSCTADFAMLIGCRGWMQVARQGAPYFSLLNATAPPTGAAATRFMKDLLPIAAQRIMSSVPNGLARFEHIASRTWTSGEKIRYLAGIDADKELSKWMSDCGKELLQTSMPDTWELMAVSAPGEGAPDKTREEDWVDGCLMGRPPSQLMATATGSGGEVTLRVSVVDPEADPNRPDINPVSVDWGDGTITGEIYRHGEINRFSHVYSGSVPNQARLVYLNDAGLSTDFQVPLP